MICTRIEYYGEEKIIKKKRRRRLIRRLILLTLLLAFVTTLAIFSPKIVKIIKLAQEAKELVNKKFLRHIYGIRNNSYI